MGKKILVVENDETEFNLVVDMLKRNGHKVVALARDGQAGLDQWLAIKARHGVALCDVVLTGFHMPRMDGDMLAMFIKGDGFKGRIVLMAHAGDKTDHALTWGVDMVIHKPISEAKIKSAIGP